MSRRFLAEEVRQVFAVEAPSRVDQALERDALARDTFFGDGEEYHISEPPHSWDELGDDIQLDDQGNPYYDIG